MTEGDGVSFAEFCYPIMQAWDWWTLFYQRKVQMQIGGSDQFGNIVTGVDLVKTVRDSEPDPAQRLPSKSKFDDPVGFTVPLLTDSSGAKFGKSAGNAIWLDQYMTSAYDLYGYFVRRPDEDVERLLKLFTFIPTNEIQTIMEEQIREPSKRVAHHRLAYEVLALVHGEQVAKQAQNEHRMMYGKDRATVSFADGTQGAQEEGKAPITLNNAPRIDMILPESLIMGKSIGRILYAAGLAKSASEGHRLASQQAVYIGGMPGRAPGASEPMDPSQLTFNPVKLWFPQETQRYLIDGRILILRRGKHNVRIIRMVSDEEYEESGQTYPGQPYTGAVRMLREHIKNLKAGLKTPDQIREAMKKEAEDEESLRKGSFIEFPEEKSQQRMELEAQLEQLMREEEKKAESS